MSLARGFKDRIRQSGIRVFPKMSCVLYVPSTRVKRCCALYVPSMRVHDSKPVRPAWLSKKEIFYGSVPVCPVLLPKESLRENIQVCPAGFSKVIWRGSIQVWLA